MDKEYWIRKHTSRKIWVALIAFITSMMMAFQADNETIQRVSAVIMAGATALAYIIGEGMIDAESVKSNNSNKKEEETENAERQNG